MKLKTGKRKTTISRKKVREAVKKVIHMCGMQGYNPMLGDTCPACEERIKKTIG